MNDTLPRSTRAALLALAWLLTFGTLSAAAEAPPTPRSLDDWVRIANHQMLSGDYDAASETAVAMRAAYPTHPLPDVVEVDVLFWRQMYDENEAQYDEPIERHAENAIALGEAALVESPDDRALRMATGKAFMQLGRLYGMNGRYYRAGVQGEKGRVHLERAFELAPEEVDARYQLGLYYYYASFVPGLVKWLDFLWFIPTGNGDEGLAYLDRVAREGDLERDNARFILSNIEMYHRKNHARGLELISALHADYPQNTMIHFEVLEALYLTEQYEKMRASALALEANPRSGALHDGRKAMARVWRARAQLALGKPEAALEILSPLIEPEPLAPEWGKAWIRLVHGQILDAQGERAQALGRYRAVLHLEPPHASHRASATAQACVEAPCLAGAPLEIGASPGG